MLYMLKLIEANGIYNDTYNEDILIDIIDNKLDTYEKVCNALQNAYDKYYETLNYKSEEDALTDGVCFGSMFKNIPNEITKENGFVIMHPIDISADYDIGFAEINKI